MKVRTLLGIIAFAAGLNSADAQQSTDYLIVKAPIGTVTPDSIIWVQWIGSSRNPLLPTFVAPDSGYIYYSRSPGGGILANYRNLVNRPWIDSSGGRLVIHDNEYTHPTASEPVAKRATAFRPSQQTDMGAGAFYCIVALPLKSDTLVSNEFQMFVESPAVVERVGPIGTITALTPAFEWKANPGVPYYHVILSDEAIQFDTSSGKINLEGLSIVWQAITPENQIVYGAPDPSKTITADPPPLSPGARYTWIVLNNYGNHMAFSSYRSAQLPPGEFTVAGTPLKRPRNSYPTGGITLTRKDNGTFSFKWDSLDARANTYKIYVYVASDFSGVLEGVSVKMAVWQSEVRAGSGTTMSVEIDAASILTSNKYIWRVMAVDEKGAGTAGDTSSFKYSAPTGTMNIYTREYAIQAQGGKLDTVVNIVGLVQASVTVLDGSMEAPLAFYTDLNGNLSRTRPIGTYRVTAIKEGFESQTRTIALGEGDTTRDTFYLQRPESQVFGRIVDESNKGINLATVTAISDRGDTMTAKSDGLGNFVVNCYAADWQVSVDMAGYKSVLPRKISLEAGKSFNFGTISMEKNPYTLSGIVKNSSQEPLIGVRVRLSREGTELDEVPSTPQSGAFSFTLAAGTYTLTAERTGFTSYSGTVDLTGSKNITVSMQPRAALVSGYVYGKSSVAGRDIIAPIPSASIAFVRTGTSDTIKGTFDAIYGNFTANLAGEQTYLVYSNASGYAPKIQAGTMQTGKQSNIAYNDTLQAYAMVSGTVRMSANGAAVGDVSINLMHLISRTVSASAKSAANGYFELKNIADGSYAVMAGKDGLVLDSIQGADTLTVSNGRPGVSSLNCFMKAGDKTISWAILGPSGVTGKVKIQSPILKTISFTDTLAKAGAGTYTLVVDAESDSLVDCSYHRFVVTDMVSRYIDTVRLNVLHTALDTLRLVNEKAAFEIHSGDSLDSARIYYKDAEGATWMTAGAARRDRAYPFSITPPKDGSVLQYYFKAYRGMTMYGYEQETYYSYIMADTARLSKYEVVPASDDTLKFPGECAIRFFFKGYYGSSFIPATHIDSQGVTWSLSNASGCTLQKSRGLSTVLQSGSTRLSSPGLLIVTVNTSRIPLKSGVPIADTVKFLISGSPLKSIVVKRIDAHNPQPISTSLADRAEFIAEGIDRENNRLALSPDWSINPAGAGTISADGTFRPYRHFMGFVRIYAKTGTVQGEYVNAASGGQQSPVIPGLNVRFLLARKSTRDTASNGKGISVIFPPNVVQGNDIGVLDLSTPDIKNLFKRGFLSTRMVDSNAYTVEELENVPLDLSADSIRIVLDIPLEHQKAAAAGTRVYRIARWNEDSLLWNPLLNSHVAKDGKTVMAGITHFSTYAIISPPGALSVEFTISPNPFSPRVRPGIGTPLGTCLTVKPEMPEVRLQKIEVRIFNLIGDLVWAVQILNARSETYSIWWDGTTTDRIVSWPDANQTTIQIKGKNLCRNGRYFAVVIVKDFNNKEKKYMKQIVLMK